MTDPILDAGTLTDDQVGTMTEDQAGTMLDSPVIVMNTIKSATTSIPSGRITTAATAKAV